MFQCRGDGTFLVFTLCDSSGCLYHLSSIMMHEKLFSAEECSCHGYGGKGPCEEDGGGVSCQHEMSMFFFTLKTKQECKFSMITMTAKSKKTSEDVLRE